MLTKNRSLSHSLFVLESANRMYTENGIINFVNTFFNKYLARDFIFCYTDE